MKFFGNLGVIGSHAKCPRLKQLTDTVSDQPEIQQVLKKNAWVFKYLTNHTGCDVTNLWDIDFLYDDLYIETLYNKTLPQWTHKGMDEIIRDINFNL